MPTSGLYAPTAASLAKARNAPPVPQGPVVKKVLSSEVAERLSKPTAASLSKAKGPVATASATPAKPRPSFGGGPGGTPVKKAASSAGSPSKASASTPLRKAASSSPGKPTTSPRKGVAGAAKAGAAGAGAAVVAAAAGATPDSETVPEATQHEPVIPEEAEAPKAEQHPAEDEEHEPHVEEEEPAVEAQSNGTKTGTEIEDMVNLLEFTPIAKIREAMQDQDAVGTEDVQDEIPDENSE